MTDFYRASLRPILVALTISCLSQVSTAIPAIGFQSRIRPRNTELCEISASLVACYCRLLEEVGCFLQLRDHSVERSADTDRKFHMYLPEERPSREPSLDGGDHLEVVRHVFKEVIQLTPAYVEQFASLALVSCPSSACADKLV